MAPRAYSGWLSGLVALGVLLRVWFAHDLEFWHDDTSRWVLSELSWSELVLDLPYQANMKSPALIAVDKLLHGLFGRSSLLALRLPSIVVGAGLIPAVAWVVRRGVGARTALVAAGLVAVSPFFVRWSIELHTYSAASLPMLLAYGLAMRDTEPLGRRRAAAVGALVGLSTAIFPPALAAAPGLLLLPAVYRMRDPKAWLAGGMACAVVALPALLSVAASARFFRPAYEREYAYSPYFNLRWSPFQVLTRLGGAELGRSARPAWLRPVLLTWGLAVAWLVVQDLRRSGPTGRMRTGVAVGGFGALVLLAVASEVGIGFLVDRYATGVAAVTVAAAACVIGGGLSSTARTTRWIAALVAVLPAAALIQGAPQLLRPPGRFPPQVERRVSRLPGLVGQELDRHGSPDLLLVHGETLFFLLELRTELAGAPEGPLRHWTTDAWLEQLDTYDSESTSVPRSYAWPYAVDRIAGRDALVTARDARRVLEAGGTCWLAFERRVHRRILVHEEAERGVGLDEALRRAPALSVEEAGAEIEAALRRLLDLPASTVVEVAVDGRAIVARLSD